MAKVALGSSQQLEFQARVLAEISEAVVAIDREGRVTYWNKGAENLYGLTAEEALGRPLHECYRFSELTPEQEREAWDMLQRGREWRRQTTHEKRYGERIHVESSVSAIEGKGGAIEALLAVIRDVSERRRYEQALEAAWERLTSVFNAMDDCLVVIGAQHDIQYTNPAARADFGSPGEMRCYEYLYGLDVPCPDCSLEEVLKEEMLRHERYSVRTGRTYDAIATPLKNLDGSISKLEILRDISERIAVRRDLQKAHDGLEALVAERTADLRESEAWLAMILNQIPCLCWTTDHDLRITSWSGSGLQARDDLLGQQVHHSMEAEHRGAAVAAHRQALGGTPSGFEFAWGKQQFECRVRPLRVEDGSIAGVVGTAFDVTEQRRVQQRLRSMAQRLVEIQEEERRDLARELHDEVGQSLTALKLAIDRGAKRAGPEASNYLAEAQALMAELISQVRDLSLTLRPKMLDDQGLLPALLWNTDRFAQRTGILVDFKHQGLDGPIAPEVVTATYRIVQEALNNVARHAEAPRVEVSVRAARNKLTLRVEDRGRGFEPDSYDGPGAGLSSMEERAIALGGSFTLDSAVGVGTRLLVELPLATGRGRSTTGTKRDDQDTPG